MVNLASLSALIRTLRQSTGVEGAAAPIARVASVAPVARDDSGAMQSTALRTSQQPRHRLPDALLERAVREPDARRREAASARDVGVTSAPRGAQAAPRAPVASEAFDGESTALVLTPAARAVQSALRATAGRVAAPPTIASPAPLASDAGAPPAQLARALADAVVHSGLFYESHLARALKRDFPLAALAREPQAGFALAVAESTAEGAPAPLLSDAASTMLARQLDALETRAVVWTGEVWPGRTATIAIEEREASEAPDDDAGHDTVCCKSWRTRVTIELPALGAIEAAIELRGDALDLAIVAHSPEAGERLDASRDALAAALADGRIDLRRFDVSAEPEYSR